MVKTSTIGRRKYSFQILEHKQRVRKHLKAASFSVMYPQMSAEKIRPEYCADCHHPEGPPRPRSASAAPQRKAPRPEPGGHLRQKCPAASRRSLQSRALLLGGEARMCSSQPLPRRPAMPPAASLARPRSPRAPRPAADLLPDRAASSRAAGAADREDQAD